MLIIAAGIALICIARILQELLRRTEPKDVNVTIGFDPLRPMPIDEDIRKGTLTPYPDAAIQDRIQEAVIEDLEAGPGATIEDCLRAAGFEPDGRGWRRKL